MKHDKKEAYAAGFEALQKLASEVAKSQQATTELVNRIVGRLTPMAETAGQTATEIKKVAARKRSKPQPDVEVETSSKKRPPPPPPASAVKAIETAAVEGAKANLQVPIWGHRLT